MPGDMHGTFTMYKGFHVEMIFSITDLELHQIIFWGSVIVCRSIDFLMTGTGATAATPSDIKLHGIPRTSPAFQGLTNCVPTYGVNIIASTNCARQGFVKKILIMEKRISNAFQLWFDFQSLFMFLSTHIAFMLSFKCMVMHGTSLQRNVLFFIVFINIYSFFNDVLSDLKTSLYIEHYILQQNQGVLGLQCIT